MKKYFILLLIVLNISSIYALAEDEDVKTVLPLILSNQTAGTEYYITFHPCWEETGPNNAIRIYVSSKVATKVTLEIPGLGIKRIQNTIPNDVIEFKLAPTEAQMYSKRDGEPPKPGQVWKGRAIHITAEDPIIVYGVTRFRYTSDGFLAIPVSSLGKNYIVSSWADPADETNQWLTSYTSIVGIYDGTKVNFLAGGGESTGNVLIGPADTLRPNGTTNAIINAGDVWLLPSIGHYSDLTGSIVSANKPVAVISGNFCAYVPTWISACDFLIEQELPTEMYSEKFHVTPIADRKKNSWIKIFSKKPETNIYRDGFLIGKIQTPGGRTGRGYLELLADEGAPRAITYSSAPGYPINIVQFNSGQGDDGVLSDPFQMALTPTDLYQNEVIFNTPGIRGGLGFARNYINVVFKAKVDGSIPDDLELGTVVNGEIIWKKINTMSGLVTFKFNDFDSLDSRFWKSIIIKLEYDGVYHVRANDKIAVYSYGFADYDSYGFPANFNAKSLEFTEQKRPTCDVATTTPKEISGTIYDEPRNDNSNRSNLANVYMLTSQSQNFTFNTQKIVSGNSTQTNWSLRQTDSTLPSVAYIVAKDYAGNDTVYRFYLTNSSIAIPKPVLVSPLDNSNNIALDTILTWKKSTVAKEYALELSDGKNLKRIYGILDTFYLCKNLETDSKYTWKVRAYLNKDTSGYSNIWSFNTVVTIPSIPDLIYPENEQDNVRRDVEFKWTKSDLSEEFEIQIAYDTNFNNLFFTKKVLNNTFQFNLEKFTNYYWRVRGVNKKGNSEWSQARWFKTNDFTSVQIDDQSKLSVSPNPAKDNLEINYNVDKDSKIKIEIYNTNGSEIATLVDKMQSSGNYKLNFNCSNLSNGQYLIKISTNDISKIEKFVVER